MQRGPQRRAVAELRIAQYRGDRNAGRADLAQQRESEVPLRLEANGGGNTRACALGGSEPLLGQIQHRAKHPRACAVPQRDGHRYLAVGDLAEGPAVLARHTDRSRPLFGKTRAVEDQNAGALGHDGAQSLPHDLGLPRGVRDEVLQCLVGAGIAESRPHRFHRLASTVAEQAMHVPPHRAALRRTTKARFEQLQPCQESLQPRGRGVIQHRCAAYRNRAKSTMPSKVFTREFTRQFVNLTK